MASTKISDEQRAVLRERQRMGTEALNAYATASDRLARAAAHRAQLLAREDALVRTAKTDLTTARNNLVRRVGTEMASELTGEPIEPKRPVGRPPLHRPSTPEEGGLLKSKPSSA
jgi:phage terminase Nu1 subunit (DNA packaging protein)